MDEGVSKVESIRHQAKNQGDWPCEGYNKCPINHNLTVPSCLKWPVTNQQRLLILDRANTS